jgi:hypothetical protein
MLARKSKAEFTGLGKDKEAMIIRMSDRIQKRKVMSDVVARKLLSQLRKLEKENTPESRSALALLGGRRMSKEVKTFLNTLKNL